MSDWDQLRTWVTEEFNWLARSVGQRFRRLRESRETIEAGNIDRLPLSRARVSEAGR